MIYLLLILQLSTIALFLGNFRNSKSTSKGSGVIVDSCGLIDGRILEIANSGFTPQKIIIPKFIINELQMLADGNDSHKRERARFGLDIAGRLKELSNLEVDFKDKDYPEIRSTDQKLIQLCKDTNSKLYTTDFNLSKVAFVDNISVLNINELAQNIKQVVLPGERLNLRVIQKGSNKGQGVAYAEDGTMVVIDNAGNLVGKSIDVVVERTINTVAGRMVFANKI
jgi:uncharacterized protein YacL